MLVTSDDVKEAKAYVQKAQSLGMPVEFWEKPRVVNAIGSEVYAGGFFDPNGGHIHPMKLVHVFKTAAENAGVGDLRKHHRRPHRGGSRAHSAYRRGTYDQGEVVSLGDQCLYLEAGILPQLDFARP